MKHEERTSQATTESSRKAPNSCAEREELFEHWRACSWSAALSERPYRWRLRLSQQRSHEVRQQHTWESSSVYATKNPDTCHRCARRKSIFHQKAWRNFHVESQPYSSCPRTSAAILMALFQSRRCTSRPKKHGDAQERNHLTWRHQAILQKYWRSLWPSKAQVRMWDTVRAEKKYLTIPDESRKKIFNRQTNTPYSDPNDSTPIKDSQWHVLGNNSRTSTALSDQVQDLGPLVVGTTLRGKAPAHLGTAIAGHESSDRVITAGPMSRRHFESL